MSYSDRQYYYRPTGFGSFSFFPPVIKSLLIINTVVFFITVVADNIVVGNTLLGDLIVYYFGLIPFSHPVLSFYPWQLITYQFLHANFTHLFFNMFMLWMFGMEIENLMGSNKFLIFYLASGIGGGILQLILGGGAPTIGASGSVFGVMVAFAMYFPDRLIFLYFLIPVKAKYLIMFLVVFEFLSIGSPSLVAHVVHFGGAVTAFFFILLDRKYRFNFSKITGMFSRPKVYRPKTPRRPRSAYPFYDDEVQEADFYEIDSDRRRKPTQEEIDRILDKISQSGYQNLTEEEKRILFEASKRD